MCHTDSAPCQCLRVVRLPYGCSAGMDGYLKAWDIASLPLSLGAAKEGQGCTVEGMAILGAVLGGDLTGLSGNLRASGHEDGRGADGEREGVGKSLERALMRQVYTRHCQTLDAPSPEGADDDAQGWDGAGFGEEEHADGAAERSSGREGRGGRGGGKAMREGVACLAVDHGVVCTGGADGIVRLWDSLTFALIDELSGHSGGKDGLRTPTPRTHAHVRPRVTARARAAHFVEMMSGFQRQ